MNSKMINYSSENSFEDNDSKIYDKCVKEIKDELNKEKEKNGQVLEKGSIRSRVNKIINTSRYQDLKSKETEIFDTILNEFLPNSNTNDKSNTNSIKKDKIEKSIEDSKFPIILKMHKTILTLINTTLPNETMKRKLSVCDITITDSIKQSYLHLSKMNSNLQAVVKGSMLLIRDNIPNNYSDGKEKLTLEEAAPYHLFPFEIIENLEKLYPSGSEFYSTERIQMLVQQKDFQVLITIDDSKSDIKDLSKQECIILERFIRFLTYFSNQAITSKYNELINQNQQCEYELQLVLLPIPFLRTEVLEQAYCSLRKHNGLDSVAKKVRDQLTPFTKEFVSRPKGIIFYGPPRTGKSFTTGLIINYLNLYKIYKKLSAADFSKGIVGQSEDMIEAISKRCDVIPWELAILYIDEIDSLVPNRNSEGTNNHQNNITAKLLSVIDGNNTKKNMLVIGTTNRLEKMDRAFTERMDIKIFLGVPNFKGRREWVENKIKAKINYNELHELNYKSNNFRVDMLVKLGNDNNLIDRITKMTLNFSADGMKKLIDSLIINLEKVDYDELSREKFNIEKIISNKIYNTILDQCKADRYYFGKYYLPDIVNHNIMVDLNSDYNYYAFSSLLKLVQESRKLNINNCKNISSNTILNNFKPNLTRRIFIDRSFGLAKDNESDPNQLKEFQSYQFQVELQKNIVFETGVHNSLLSFINHNNANKYEELYDYLEDNLKTADNVEVRKAYNFLTNELKKKRKQEQSSKENYDYRNMLREILNSELLLDCYSKPGGFKSLEEALFPIILIAVEDNLDFVLLLDSSYFYKRDIITEDKIMEEFISAVEETKRYENAMIIIDLDSLFSTVKEYSNETVDLFLSSSKMYEMNQEKISFREHFNNTKLFQVCLNYFEEFLGTKSSHWIVAISSQTKVSMLFKEKLNWTKTKIEKQVENDIKNNLVEKQCIWCKEIFSINSNKFGACMRHSDKCLYREQEYNFVLARYNELHKNDKNFDFNKYNRYIFQNINFIIPSKAIYEVNNNKASATSFKWICCSKSLFEKGEIAYEHESEY